ncbi:CZB domain-containing protein [Rhodoferax sp.]|uniref:CZB domain-containing protein n=1 Tax=Rhodoferax sp. TaxID=50421 RepID=UPI002617FCF0|nr:CZB domain-containing protein [Rhodoferax sp.]MDD2925872.1 CZB domain-containing protein [Rhodoferax sp.]
MGFFDRLFGKKKDDNDNNLSGSAGPESQQASDMGLDGKSAAAILAEIDIDKAISAHENWKARLQNYLDGQSTEDLKPEVICLDNRCDLGQWLHGPGQQRLGKYPAFSALIARHQHFHLQAANVVTLVQADKKAEASRVMDSSYRHASNQVVLLLKELKRGLGR